MVLSLKSNYFTETLKPKTTLRLFDLSLQLNGFNIQKAKSVLSTIQAKSDKDFQLYVEDQKKAIILYHLAHNPFYKTLGKAIDVEDWDTVPILTKRHLQHPLEQRLSTDYTPDTVYKNKTSGSSGDPFIFAKDKWCHALTWAEIMNRFGWYGIDFNHSKQARFYGIPLDKKGYYKERLKDYFSNRYRFSVFDLSDTAFEKALSKFQVTHFNFINGYTSAIVQFAKFLKRKNIILKRVCPSLQACIVTSEMLFDADKELLETQFGLPVINEYGASELDLIAFQNPQNEWQVNSETLLVEILDVNNKVLPYGEEGRVVITSLYNKAHPFIRYDLGDIGILSEESTLRKPILKKLTGRTNSIVVLPSGKKAAGLTFYYITKSVIEDDGNVSEFIVEQTLIDHFIIRYVSVEALKPDKQDKITSEIKRYLESGIKVSFERVPQLKRTKAGKLKQFISKL